MTDETAARAELLLMADNLAEHMAAFRDRLLVCESINVASEVAREIALVRCITKQMTTQMWRTSYS